MSVTIVCFRDIFVEVVIRGLKHSLSMSVPNVYIYIYAIYKLSSPVKTVVKHHLCCLSCITSKLNSVETF